MLWNTAFCPPNNSPWDWFSPGPILSYFLTLLLSFQKYGEYGREEWGKEKKKEMGKKHGTSTPKVQQQWFSWYWDTYNFQSVKNATHCTPTQLAVKPAGEVTPLPASMYRNCKLSACIWVRLDGRNCLQWKDIFGLIGTKCKKSEHVI